MLDRRDLETAARVMRALAHPLRLAILQSLAGGEKTVTELYQALGCSQPMMSQQLRNLEQQQLISSRKEGTTKYCGIRNPDFLQLFHCLDKHLTMFLGRPQE